MIHNLNQEKIKVRSSLVRTEFNQCFVNHGKITVIEVRPAVKYCFVGKSIPIECQNKNTKQN